MDTNDELNSVKMGRKSNKEKQLLPTLSRDPDFVKEDMLAMSRMFADAMYAHNSECLTWSSLQQRIFAEIMAGIDWRSDYIDKDKNVYIDINNNEAMKNLGWTGERHAFNKMFIENLLYMSRNSNITIRNFHTGDIVTSNIIVNAIIRKKGVTRVELNRLMLPYLQQLFLLPQTTNASSKINRKRLSFFQMIKQDLFEANNRFIILLLEDLLRCASGQKKTRHEISLERLYELLGLDEGSYYKEKDDKTGEYYRFDKNAFCKRILDPTMNYLKNIETIEIYPTQDGALYELIYTGRVVSGIAITYRIRSENQIAKMRLRAKNL